jgi:hypothetical protein
MPVILAFRRWRQEDQEFKASLDYIRENLSQRNKTNKTKQTNKKHIYRNLILPDFFFF